MDDLQNPNDMKPTETSSSSGFSSFNETLPSDQASSPVYAGSTSAGADFVRDQDKIMLVLAYFLPIIPLLVVKDSEYVLWHARQGLVLCIASIVLSFSCIVPLLCFVAAIKGVLEALKPNRWEIPGVYNVTKAIFSKK